MKVQIIILLHFIIAIGCSILSRDNICQTTHAFRFPALDGTGFPLVDGFCLCGITDDLALESLFFCLHLKQLSTSLESSRVLEFNYHVALYHLFGYE